MPRLRQLRQFIAIAEERNYRRAAERLNMTQPPLSQSMHLLEDELGVSLMERDRRGVTLTTAGEVFLAESRLVIAQMDRAVAVTRGTVQGMTGRLVIGFGHSTTFYLVPETLRRFAANHPTVDLVLEELATVEQVDALSDGRIDLGLLRPPVGRVVTISPTRGFSGKDWSRSFRKTTSSRIVTTSPCETSRMIVSSSGSRVGAPATTAVSSRPARGGLRSYRQAGRHQHPGHRHARGRGAWRNHWPRDAALSQRPRGDLPGPRGRPSGPTP